MTLSANWEVFHVEIDEFRIALISLLNSHFLNLPDSKFIEYTREDDYLFALAALRDDETADPDLREGARLMESYIRSRFTMDKQKLSLEMGVDRTRLYRGATPQYSPDYPCEAVWQRYKGDHEFELVEEVAAFYRNYGIVMASDVNERPDYIGIELGFFQRLMEEVLIAHKKDDRAKGQEYFTAARSFFTIHLNWLPAFIEAARPIATTDFYRGHLLMLMGFYNTVTSSFAEIG